MAQRSFTQRSFNICLDSGSGRYTKDLVGDEDVVFPQPSHADTFDHMTCLYQSSILYDYEKAGRIVDNVS
jgi:hypothetical protein